MMTVSQRHALWIGDSEDDELRLARSWMRPSLEARQTPLLEFSRPADAATLAAAEPATPRLAILATDRPARWTLDDAIVLARAWPLMPIVSVATSLVDGRRRSGPPLPGVEEVAWHEFPGRMEAWLADWDAGRPGTLAAPATARRDERLLGITMAEPAAEPLAVSVVAGTPMDAEGISLVVPPAGGHVVASRCGRPALDESANVLVWDVGRLSPDTIGWLGILAANRPSLAIVIVDSFPRGDTAQAALDAGATAVLGKPISIEALAGTFRRLKAGTDGLGGPSAGR